MHVFVPHSDLTLQRDASACNVPASQRNYLISLFDHFTRLGYALCYPELRYALHTF
jgi:hypothetical protein